MNSLSQSSWTYIYFFSYELHRFCTFWTTTYGLFEKREYIFLSTQILYFFLPVNFCSGYIRTYLREITWTTLTGKLSHSTQHWEKMSQKLIKKIGNFLGWSSLYNWEMEEPIIQEILGSCPSPTSNGIQNPELHSRSPLGSKANMRLLLSILSSKLSRVSFF